MLKQYIQLLCYIKNQHLHRPQDLAFNNFTTDHVHHWRLIVEEYSPTIYFVKGVHNIIADRLSRVPRQDAHVPEIIETCFLMETEHSPFDFAIIAQLKRITKNYNKLSITFQWNTSCTFTMNNSSFISTTKLLFQSKLEQD